MKKTRLYWLTGLFAASLLGCTSTEPGPVGSEGQLAISPGQRPLFLVDGMDPGDLKESLQACASRPLEATRFSIGHRGAPLQFPEHTRASYVAAARQGAGRLECDVTFTADGTLVCRHAQCDLATTTNVLVSELASRCEEPFTPAEFDPQTGERLTAASAKCCTSALTREEFLSLEGKMDAHDPDARTLQEFMGGTPDWQTDLYASRGQLMTHRQSIELFDQLGVDFIPELKAATGDPDALLAVFFPDGDPDNPEHHKLARERYAQALIADYRALDIAPARVWAQSFEPEDVLYWIEQEPEFGQQAVLLESRYNGEIDPVNGEPEDFLPDMQGLADRGVQILAPPLYFLLRVNDEGELVPSPYALAARNAGLKLVAWTVERTDLRNGSRIGVNDQDRPLTSFYYQFDTNPNAQAVTKDSDLYPVIDALAQKVGVTGIFSDWPATVSYYASCMELD